MPLEMRLAGGAGRGSLLSTAFSSAASGEGLVCSVHHASTTRPRHVDDTSTGEGLMCFFHGPGELWISRP